MKQVLPYFIYGCSDFLVITHTARAFLTMCERKNVTSFEEILAVLLLAMIKGYIFSVVYKFGFAYMNILKINTTKKDIVLPFYSFCRGLKKILEFFNRRRKRFVRG